MALKGKTVNGHAPPNVQSAEKRMSRTPRRSQQPKTLNSPEDSTYYNLIHRSVQDDKRKPRKDGSGKLLDPDDQYYPGLSPSSSPERGQSTERSRSRSGSPQKRPQRERAVTEPPPAKANQDNRHSLPRMASTDSKKDDNPYDYRHLLRKTSQRQRLIKQY